MSDQEQSELVDGWIERARSDLILGQTALITEGVLPEDACFHAQQAAEKALKALLIRLTIPFPRTHILEVLLDLLKTKGVSVPDSVDEAFRLTQYSVQTRYPGDWEPVSSEEATQALELASLVLNWAENQLKSQKQ